MDTGMVRKIDDLGRIVVPAETRRLFNIQEGDQLTISVEGDAIVVRKLEATCTFCGSTTEVAAFKGKGICSSCRSQLGG
ncbi:MAG: AbrB/MazE/SpoVT family DNA-binding domain-containing protein [Acidimicrobiia bacterium]|nr:AbrB/MazE/SpoVT family DNA-binding domain-containing protein [Acidimicrobiia bacterium]